MKCKTVQKQMILFSANELVRPENKEFHKHLKDCPKCNSMFLELETVFKLTEKKESLKPNPFLYTRIKQRLDTIEAEKRHAVIRPVFKKVLQPVLITLILSVALFSGIKLGNTFEVNQSEKTSVSQTTEFYFNDFQQEKLEVLLLKE